MNSTIMNKPYNDDFEVTPNEVYTDLEKKAEDANDVDENWICVGEDTGGWTYWNTETGCFVCSNGTILYPKSYENNEK